MGGVVSDLQLLHAYAHITLPNVAVCVCLPLMLLQLVCMCPHTSVAGRSYCCNCCYVCVSSLHAPATTVRVGIPVLQLLQVAAEGVSARYS